MWMSFLSVACVGIHFSGSYAVQSDICRYGNATGCVFPCLCTRSCDKATGDCLDGGECSWDNPRSANIRRSGPGCKIANIALGKNAYQSGTYGDLSADLAVDGDVNSNPNRCAHPQSGQRGRAWWYVDLGEKYDVLSVTIFNRKDNSDDGSYKRQGYFRLGVGDTINGDLTPLCKNYVGPVPDGGKETISCDATVSGRYVTIIRDNSRQAFQSNFLNLCEVMVHGYKAINCDECHADCTSLEGCSACRPGVLYPDCVTVCPAGRYGDNCLKTCSENCGDVTGDSSVCYRNNGSCVSGCETPQYQTWYKGDKCDMEIPYVEFVPGEKPEVRNVTSSTITLVWTGSPSIQSYLSHHYGLKLFISQNVNTLQMTKIEWNHTLWRKKLLIQDLKADTTYYFQISILRRGRDGVIEESKIKTNVVDATTSSVSELTTTITESTTKSGSVTNDMDTGGSGEEAAPTGPGDKKLFDVPLIAGSAAGAVLLIALVVILMVYILTCRRRSDHLRPTTAMEAEKRYRSNTRRTLNRDSNEGEPASAQVTEQTANRNMTEQPTTAMVTEQPAIPEVAKQPGVPKVAATTKTAIKEKQKIPKQPGVVQTKLTELTKDQPSYVDFPAVEFVMNGTYIRIEDLEQYIGAKKFTETGFKKEFDEIPEFMGTNWHVAGLEENVEKNRFKNIKPYDNNRVILQDGSDFINASYITGYPNKDKHYVATQGPRPNTTDDFWKMIWQLNSNRIVALTRIFELGRQKCEQYWPTAVGEKKTYKNITVTTTSSDKYANFNITNIGIQYENETREVIHLQFLSWPDKKCPDDAFPLLSFRRKVRSLDQGSTGPMVVHCSAGVGRSGTFIALDSLLDQIKQEGKLDVMKQLTRMRGERMKMIQTLPQYIFLHEALLEAYQQGDTAIPCTLFSERYGGLISGNDYCNETPIEEQFQTLARFKVGNAPDAQSGLKAENAYKNRDSDIVPEDTHRVYLSGYFKERNDYINAIMVDSYMKENAFIVTQLPLSDTIVDFWRMVYDQKCHTLVVLEKPNVTEDCPHFWPDEKDKVLTFETLEIKYIGVQNTDDAFGRFQFSVSFSSSKTKEPLLVSLVFFKTWLSGQELPEMDDMLSLLHLMYTCQRKDREGKVLVQCKDGAGRSGLVCAAYYVLEKMKADSEVDVFLAVRAVALHRHQFVKDLSQYKYLHALTMEYMKIHKLYENFE